MAEQHDSLIRTGLDLHEARKYDEALPYFQRAFAACPDCVAAQYNLANTLHMLDRDKQAAAMLQVLLNTSDEVFFAGCPLEVDPRPFKLDALFLMFITTLHHSEDWDLAFPFAQQHLLARGQNIQSVWSDAEIHALIEDHRAGYVDE